MNPETVITILLAAAALCMLASIVFCIMPSESKTRLAAGITFSLGTLVCLALFGYNYHLAQAPPFGNMFQVMSFMPLTLALLYLYVKLVQKQGWLLGYFAAASLIALIGAFCMPFQANWTQMPALQSPWFVPHVAAYILSYALATVGTLLALVSFFTRREKDKYISATHGMILLAFPFMSFGLWSGALWADEVWGGYWAWDIKEVWSLITWGLYLIYFHIRSIPSWNKHGRTILFIAYAALLTTFIIVNLLPQITSMHSYAM